MRNILHGLFSTLLVLITTGGCCQWDSLEYAERDTSRIIYDGGFDFREGIYFGFEDFRANRPSVALKDLLNDQGKHAGDLRQSNGKLFYKDSTGAEQRIDLALQLSQRCLVLDRGRCVFEGKSSEISGEPSNLAALIGLAG